MLHASQTNFSKGFVGLVTSFILGLSLLSGCASTHTQNEAYDPMENFNRSMHTFNGTIDRIFMKPVAEAYVDNLHPNFRLSVSNFNDNLSYLNVILNDFLQGKVRQGFADVGRFALNTTLGVAGIFDAASVFEFEKNNEDFGQTLAVWGVAEGPYIEAPLLGPSTSRDILDHGSSTLTNALTYVSLPVIVAGVTFTPVLILLAVIDKRARAVEALRARDEMALDSYVFTREAYRQHRIFDIYDGNPPTPELLEDQAFIEELEEELELELEIEDPSEESSEMSESVEKPSLPKDPKDGDSAVNLSMSEKTPPSSPQPLQPHESPPSHARKISYQSIR